ncbi:histidine kinase,7TM-containing protein possibly involved in signal transduction,histidine kinase [Owenweeksia hongkongensis DSM 17368]|uniref:histidine kinase n=1 Tax=Owenweeksia hongkongensis (strain DSM 17368 / CIP 108786 / JCM 12287 / NRRL B-23963 / UST20020801) TaxID=926562 RepID=G8R776_OWEHD|nr:7TM diverse intracellular signaling domain-containing protein [Owenweeksia hongkongensis]AEV34483.1 histidine kinase,7TM-containing protein possibly involved in signal transduction,histidine kinase [Owenweeksia hongkongensis DSM 17368]
MRKYILALLLIITSLKGFGQEITYDCNSENNEYFGNQLEYYKTDKSLAVKDLERVEFKKISQDVPNFGVTESTIWLKGKLRSLTECEALFEIENQSLDTVEFFLFQGDDLVAHSVAGQQVPVREWEVKNPVLGFPFQSLENAQLDFYFKVKSKKQIIVPITVRSMDSFYSRRLESHIKTGLYFGIILVMILYNLFLFISVRDINFLYYILYIASVGLAQGTLMGFTTIYLWPNNDWLVENAVYLFGILSGLFTAIFVISFIKTKEYVPILHKFFVSFIVLYGVITIMVLTGYELEAYQAINLIAGVGAIVALIAAIAVSRKGYMPAKFFLFAYSFFLGSIIILVLKDYGILPYNEFTKSSVIYGSSFEIVLLSLALANRINVLREEKEASQAEALRALRENEKIIREQNVLLEQRVNERTLELQEANEELTVTLSNLKDTQTQLVDAEKMASLGQLTAGIAHEINNPINFVTSNIKPLKRDLVDVYELVDAYTAIEEEGMADALKKAHELKEEIDYDYIKEEIESLVQGISDGANRTSEIVRGLKNFSRLDEDVVKPADLHEGLSSTIVLLQSKIKEGIKVVKDFDENLPKIDCYPGKLNQVFMNILNNGIYAVSHKNYEEDEAPTLTLKTQMNKSMVSVHLIDNGIGMDEATKKKIFDPFFTTKDVGEGTGLGMSIVYKIVEKHGGTMTVNSELGKGTEFIITLPLRQPNEFQ